jgi:hypothetical protein
MLIHPGKTTSVITAPLPISTENLSMPAKQIRAAGPEGPQNHLMSCGLFHIFACRLECQATITQQKPNK